MIRILKLTSGDEIIGEVSSKGIFNVAVKNPLKIIYNHDANNGTNVFMFPWIGASNENLFTIKTKDIMVNCCPDPMLVGSYNEILNPSEKSIPKEPVRKSLEERIQVAESTVLKHLLNSVEFSKKDIQ